MVRRQIKGTRREPLDKLSHQIRDILTAGVNLEGSPIMHIQRVYQSDELFLSPSEPAGYNWDALLTVAREVEALLATK